MELWEPTTADALHALGGVATRSQLVQAVGRRAFDASVRAGDVVRLARGRYALPSAEESRASAHALKGALCLLSAALAWGWAVKNPPAVPQVVVPKHRRVATARASGVELHRADLMDDEVVGGCTSRERTLGDCLRQLPFDEALAVADSALREGFSRARLMAIARDLRGPGSARARRVALAADARAANPFESVLRAIALDVVGLCVTPQVSLRRLVAGGAPLFLARPDLVDQRLGIVLEAESFEWHGERAALHRDARRYNALASDGWLVLRFSWADVMHHPEHVRAVLERAVAERTEQLCPACRHAG